MAYAGGRGERSATLNPAPRALSPSLPQNNPLFLETYGPGAASPSPASSTSEDALRFHYAVHCALDAVEERRELQFFLKRERERERDSHSYLQGAAALTLPPSLPLPSSVSAPRPRATAPDPDAGYLGVLYPTDDCVVYGAAGPTGVKVILVAADPQPAEDAVQGAAAALAAAYGEAAANPFYTPGTPLESARFAARVRAIVQGVA